MFRHTTTPGHSYTVEAFVHVLTDLERLSDSELTTAANLYPALHHAGMESRRIDWGNGKAIRYQWERSPYGKHSQKASESGLFMQTES